LGNIYVAGQVPPASLSGSVSAPILPIPSGVTPFQAVPKGKNVGILKLNSTTTAILAATYLGGSGEEEVGGLAVDSGNNVYIVGTTTSNDFPTSQNTLQSSLGSSGQNIFVTKLDANLSSEVYSTYLGANSTSSVGISSDDIVTPNAAGVPLVEGSAGLAVDTSKNVYIAGNANLGFPTTNGAIQTVCSVGTCPVVAKLDPSGSSLLYATYLTNGLTGPRAYTVAVDGSQNIYVGGTTGAGYPELNALQPCNPPNGYLVGFVSEIDAAGTLTFSTCLATSNGSVLDLVLDSAQNLDIVGYGSNLLLKNPIQTNANLFTDAFVASIAPNSNPPSLLFSSYIGSGNEAESFGSVGVDSGGNIYAAGGVEDGPTNFPVFNALQPTIPFSPSFQSAAFIMKISPTNAAAAALSPGALIFVAQQVVMPSSPQTVTVFDLGSAALMISNVTASGDFSVQNNCGTVSPSGGTCTLPVTFTPSALGTRNGTLTITDSSAGSPRTVQLTGQGGQALAALSPVNLAFSSQLIGTVSAPQTITLTNGGAVALQVSHVQVSGPFAESNTCGSSVGAGLSCQISITFNPTASGAATGTLTITDSAPDSPQTVSLTGNGAMGFAMSASASSATVSAGAIATFNLTATAANGFSGSVNFTCSGAPSASICKVSPNPLTLTGGTPANFTVTVATTAHSVAQLNTGQGLSALAQPGGGLGLMAGWLGLPFVLLPLRLGAKRGRRTRLVLVGLVILSAASLGCGSGSPSSPSPSGTTRTPSGTYTITVNGTVGTATQSANLTLIVQ
jgi:hypothetical protein